MKRESLRVPEFEANVNTGHAAEQLPHEAADVSQQSLEWTDHLVSSTNWYDCWNDAISKAFQASDSRVRLAYLELAEFYERQHKRLCGDGKNIN